MLLCKQENQTMGGLALAEAFGVLININESRLHHSGILDVCSSSFRLTANNNSLVTRSHLAGK